MADANQKYSLYGLLGAVWGVAGLALILLDAINRLARLALQALGTEIQALHYLVLVVVVIVMAYTEGYRGFQKSFSPRSAARAYYLYKNPDPLTVVLAPLFCMGFFRATRGPLMFAWVGTGLIVLFIIALQVSPQPWRGIVDTGVVVGLSWGLMSFLVSVWRVFSTGVYALSPAVPAKDGVKDDS
jgi:hypothetical protein